MTQSTALDEARRQYIKDRVRNLRVQIPMVRVIEMIGLPLRTTAQVEIQYPCPLHGDGSDRGYSARIYPGNDEDDPGGHTYCWGCHKYRNQIDWVSEYEGMSFFQTLKFLEREFDVKDVPVLSDYLDPKALFVDAEGQHRSRFEAEISAILSPIHTETQANPEADILRLLRRLDRSVEERKSQLSMKHIVTLYHLCDALLFDYRNNHIDNIYPILTKLTEKVDLVLKSIDQG